jgi:hypothetical protein
LNLAEVIFGKSAKKPKTSLTSKEYREKIYKEQSEEFHQKNLVLWLEKKGIYYEISISGIYLPNPHKKGSVAWQIQNKANLQALNKMRGQGWNKGVCDIKVYLPKVELNIELKTMRGRASKEQLETKKKIDKFKYAEYHIVKGYLNAIELIEKNI